MFARQRLVAIVAVLMPSAMAAQGFEYAPGTQQFRVTQVTKVTQEVMGQKNEFETTSLQLFTLSLARQSRDTIAMTVVVDSISQTGPMGPTAGLEKLQGVKLDARLSPNGTLYSTSARDSAIAGATELAGAAGRFLPRIRGRLGTGSTWVDTVSGKVRQQGVEVDRKTISTFAVIGDTTVAGEKSWKLTREDKTQLSGNGMTQGQAITMEGTAVGKGTLFVSQRGALVGSVGTEEADIKIVLPANGAEIKVLQSATSKVEKVK